jgi:nicotinamide-nucleotide amidase
MPLNTKAMNAEIITIGDELLIGQTVDTNSAWMGKSLNRLGISVVQIRSIADQANDIIQALETVRETTSLVLITGGLGPTKDDITKATLCTYFQDELVLKEEVLEQLKAFFERRGRTMGRHNYKQAMVLSGSDVLPNSKGTAPGMWMKKNKKHYVSMPGVPYEMKAIMEEHVFPKLAGMAKGRQVIHKHIHTQGIPESELMVKIAEWEEELPAPMKLAYLPSPGMVKLRISVSSNDDEVRLRAALEKEVTQLESLIPAYIVGYDEDSLESGVGALLRRAKQTLATAESCTGGYIAHQLTSLPGSSDYFMASVVAYDNTIKRKLLDVRMETLTKHGAVSEAVVEEMVAGVLKKTGADWAIATSGIAGPTGGTDQKPVGTVWVAVGNAQKTISSLHLFGNDRLANIQRASNVGLQMLRKELLNLFVD